MEPHEYRWILQEARFLCLTPSLRLGELQRTKSQFRIAGLFPLPSREQVLLLKPLANGRNNIVGCYMLRPPCCMLLAVVACCCAKFETGQTFQPPTPNISFVPWSPKPSATMLDPFAQLFQRCWLMSCILPTMHCRSQTCWELLHPFAYHCQHARNLSGERRVNFFADVRKGGILLESYSLIKMHS